MKRADATMAIAAMLVTAGLWSASADAQTSKPTPPKPRVAIQDGKIVITPESNGDRIVDFSTAGYMAGASGIPTPPAKVLVSPIEGDATALINAALAQVAALPADANGHRGAVLLAPGVFKIEGQVRIAASGVVLRGSGVDQTTLLATGYDRRALVKLAGREDRTTEPEIAIAGSYVPAGTTTFTVASHNLKAGDTVVITRPCTDEWTVAMKMDEFGGDRHGLRWNPGSRVLTWDRVVTHVESNTVTVDAPITFGLDKQFGGGTIARYAFPGRISQSGVENLTLDSTFDAKNPKDEDHAWFGLVIDDAQDVWARRVVSKHFTGGAVAVWNGAKRVTVEDAKSLAPIGEIGGGRRQAFIVEGQQVLMQRLWSEDAVNDFAVGFAAAGPNVFSVCESQRSTGDSGAIDSWAAGALFEHLRIDGGDIALTNLGHRKQCAGWSGVNSVIWNSAAGVIHCFAPPQGSNYAVGTNGEFNGNGIWWASDDGSPIESLYYAQLSTRVGADAAARAKFVTHLPEGSRRSTASEATELVALTRKPQQTVSDLIDASIAAEPIDVRATDAVAIAQPIEPKREPQPQTFAVFNGWLVASDRIVTGSVASVPWWNARLRPPHVSKQPALTRFVPGKEGTGFTDDLASVADSMAASGTGAIVQHPPLWYERRRDDHQRVRRSDAEVVAPFYEWPFARSGQGRAYDGLSQWDLTKPNQYYYLRLREFAGHASRNGVVLFNEHYMQHNILEAGAHYADFPWRPANNVNDTGLPEPVGYAGDKLIYIGESFYDVQNNAKLRALHRQYIRTQLDELKNAPSVVHLTSEEYTGSLAFTQFWIDTIAEWEKETGRNALVGLYAPKDVTDAILADAGRSKTVEVIFNRYNTGDAGFWYSGDKLYAPPGGNNLSPRQWQRQGGAGKAGVADVARMITEYRGKHPDKAFAYVGENSPEIAWVSLLAGGSMTAAPVRSADLAKAIARMKPVAPNAIADGDRAMLIYFTDAMPVEMPVKGDAQRVYRVSYLDPASGDVKESRDVTLSAAKRNIEAPKFAPYLIWLEEVK